jgi:hypothetical protein
MPNKLYDPEDVKNFINQGKTLVLSGDESILAELPKGNWIGGTIPYFMDPEGGIFTKEKIFVEDFSEVKTDGKIEVYDKNSIENIVNNSYENGFTYLLLPGMSEIHSHYALIANDIDGIFNNPVTGWITGIDLNDLGNISPKVFHGQTGLKSDKEGVALHIKIPEQKRANLEIINIFSQGDGDVLTFNEEGFSCKECNVNGEPTNFANYIVQNNVDTRLPIVADYSGAMINISFQKVDIKKNEILFYAPVRKGIEYRLAKPVGDYVKIFNEMLPTDTSNVVSSCNCILNYLYSELEGKETRGMYGPITFGEIAYVLVNQILVYLSVE